jgi:hypothetical protein
VLEAYGEIIYRAWRDSAGSASQHEIESTCIQVQAFKPAQLLECLP